MITNAATGNANVKALVYIDAYIPDPRRHGLRADRRSARFVRRGQTPSIWCRSPGRPRATPMPILRVGPNKTYPGFASCFANGLSSQEAALLAASQRPAALSAGTEPSGPPAWKQIPSWDLIGTADHVIPPAEQLFMAHRAGAHITEVNAGHLSLISHPDAAVGIILKAVQATS